MSRVERTNAAKRALNFINGFKEHSGTSSASTSRRLARHTLASMYDLDPNDTSLLMTVLSDAWKLPVQIRQSINKAGLALDAFQPVIRDLEKVLTSMMLDNQSNHIKNNIPPTLGDSLGMVSVILDKDAPEALLSHKKAEEILESISLLRKDIRSADLDSEFTDFILHKIASIEYAISHYETLGTEEVILRVDQMFGGILRQYQSLSTTPVKSKFVSRTIEVGAVIIYAIGALNSVVELPDNVMKLIDASIHIETGELIDIGPKDLIDLTKKDDIV
jgi:hypothetical protein